MLRTLAALAVFISSPAQAQFFGPPVYSSPPVYYGPSVCAPPATIYYPATRTVLAPPTYIHIVGIVERTRVNKPVIYGGKWKLVPIINGYAPIRKHEEYSDGSDRIWYDYSSRIPYASLDYGVRVREPEIRTPEIRTPERDRRPVAPREDWDPVNPFVRPRDDDFRRRPSDVEEPSSRSLTPSYRNEG